MCNYKNKDKKKPFIKLIKTPYGFYIFDVNTNSILKIDEGVYEYLIKLQTNNQNQETNNVSMEVLNKIKKLKYKGFLSAKRPKRMEHPQTKYLKYQLSNKIGKITLQVTQQCNLRCSYCIYSENDNEMQREHSDNIMSFETAKKAIDFLRKNSTDSEEINIGFYGGEPLLKFDFIKKCIKYAQKTMSGKNITFNITTNGTLLTLDKISFLREYDISILISLDGPKDIHDSNRKFINGEGSFEIIQENLKEIKNKYPDFSEKIGFSMVIDPENDLNCVNQFLINYDMIKDSSVLSSLIDDKYSKEKITVNSNYVITSTYEYFKMLLSKFGKISGKLISPISRRRYANFEMTKDHLKKMVELPDVISHSGPCVPGANRLFVDTRGNLFPCEKVSEVSNVMKIGNIEEGFKLNKVEKLLNVAKLTEDTCKNCWALVHCTQCAANADNLKELSAEKKLTFCNRVKGSVLSKLKDFIALNEIKSIYNENFT